MSGEACANCLAFFADDDDAGQCRRYAPCPLPERMAAQLWPVVKATDCCLEHRQSVAPYNLTFIPAGEA